MGRKQADLICHISNFYGMACSILCMEHVHMTTSSRHSSRCGNLCSDTAWPISCCQRLGKHTISTFRAESSTLKKEVVRFSDVLLTFYKFTRCYKTDEHSTNLHFENLQRYVSYV